MTAIPYELRLLMIEVGAAYPFYQQPPMFPKACTESAPNDAPRPSTASAA